jgi:YD repeat-containing protein
MPSVSGPCSFEDVRGNTFDALDRSLAKYEVAVGSAAEATNIYDGGGNAGLLYQKTTGTNQTDTLAYDADGHVTSETFNDGTANRTYTYDADGRALSLATGSVGTETRTYDADGHVATSTAPSSLLNGATITYGYYADGLRSSLSLNVPSQNFNQSNLFTYDYRADGARNSLNVTDGSLTGTFGWGYTKAGRELTQSDPDTGDKITINSYGQTITLGAKTYTYDTYGRVASLTLPDPQNTYSSLSYDAEDELLSATVPINPSTVSYSYTVRGEVTGPAGSVGYMANGATCQQMPIQNASGSCSLDARSDAVLSTQYTSSTQQTTTHSYTYDAAGRQATDTSDWCGTWPNEKSTRTYNADSHVVQQTMPAEYDPGNPPCDGSNGPMFTNPTTNTYTWAGDGHLGKAVVSYTSNGATYSTTTDYQWDGDDALYYTQNDNGANDGLFLYIEKLGYISNGYFVVYDRDWTGAAAQLHDSDGYTGWAPDALQVLTKGTLQCAKYGFYCRTQGVGYVPTLSGLNPMRADGYGDSVNVFQGVRAYDPNSAQWTAPDAYAGEVHDPMSQKPYMWNRNNALEYSDPSGYCVGPLIVPCFTALMHAAIDLSSSQDDKDSPVTILLYKRMPDGTTSLPSELAPNERILDLPVMRGWTPRQYAIRNASRLRQAMRAGVKIKDTYVNDNGSLKPSGGFLGLERNILENAKWSYDPKTQTWSPPPGSNAGGSGSGSSLFYDSQKTM